MLGCQTGRRDADEASFAFVSLDNFMPKLAELIKLRELLGLRSPVHSLSRMLNPFNAQYLLQGIFHPGYKAIHREAAVILEQPHMAVLKGEGGEIEINPDIDSEIAMVRNGQTIDEQWPAMFGGQRHVKEATMDVMQLKSVWRGDTDNEYGIAAVTRTAAIALRLMEKADSVNEAQNLAERMWAVRDYDRL